MSSLESFDSQNSQPDNLEVSLSQSDPDDAPLSAVPPKDDRGLSDELSHINIGITEELQSPTQETVGREPETIGREPETTGMEPETAGSEPNNNELTIKRGKKRILRDQAGDEGSDSSTSGTSQTVDEGNSGTRRPLKLAEPNPVGTSTGSVIPNKKPRIAEGETDDSECPKEERAGRDPNDNNWSNTKGKKRKIGNENLTGDENSQISTSGASQSVDAGGKTRSLRHADPNTVGNSMGGSSVTPNKRPRIQGGIVGDG